MSAWILGSEIAASLGLLDFEFAKEYVARGLIPHNREGQPYMPPAVVSQIIAGLDEEHAQHEELAWNLKGYEREEVIAKYIEPLQQRIQFYRNYFQSLNGSAWDGFELPQDQDLSRHFIRVLLNSYYRRDEVNKRLPPQSEIIPDQEPGQPAQIVKQVEKKVKRRKLISEQRLKIDCRAVAQKIWTESPGITIEDMIQRDEVANACEGIVYDEKTIRNWINDLCPNRRPGRPKKKRS